MNNHIAMVICLSIGNTYAIDFEKMTSDEMLAHIAAHGKLFEKREKFQLKVDEPIHCAHHKIKEACEHAATVEEAIKDHKKAIDVLEKLKNNFYPVQSSASIDKYIEYHRTEIKKLNTWWNYLLSFFGIFGYRNLRS